MPLDIQIRVWPRRERMLGSEPSSRVIPLSACQDLYQEHVCPDCGHAVQYVEGREQPGWYDCKDCGNWLQLVGRPIRPEQGRG